MQARTIFAALCTLSAFVNPCTAEVQWIDDIPAALARAKAENKALLIYRHKDSNIPYCAELRREFAEHPDFESYVTPRFILVDADAYLNKNYPKDQAWRNDYAFVSKLVVITQDGVALGALDGPYDDKGYTLPLQFDIVTEILDKALLQKEAIDTLMAQAQKKEGVEKAKYLLQAYDKVEETRNFINDYYNNPLQKAIIASDPLNQLNVFHEDRKRMIKAAFITDMKQELHSLPPQQAYHRITEMLQNPLYDEYKLDLYYYQFLSSDSTEDIRQVIESATLYADSIKGEESYGNLLEVLYFIKSKDEEEILQEIHKMRAGGGK